MQVSQHFVELWHEFRYISIDDLDNFRKISLLFDDLNLSTIKTGSIFLVFENFASEIFSKTILKQDLLRQVNFCKARI